MRETRFSVDVPRCEDCGVLTTPATHAHHWYCVVCGTLYFVAAPGAGSVVASEGHGYEVPELPCLVDAERLEACATYVQAHDDGFRHAGDWWRPAAWYNHPDVPHDVWRFLTSLEQDSELSRITTLDILERERNDRAQS